MKPFNLRTTLLVAALGFSSSAWSQVSVQPATPALLETVHVMAPASAISSEYSIDNVSMVGNSITVTLGYPVAPYGAPMPPLDAVVGQLPAGNYDVTVVASNGVAVVATIGTAHFTVAPKDRTKFIPDYDYTDLWWTPSESGWGMTITQHASTNMVVTWFVYGSDGKPTWYVVPNGSWFGETFIGTAYRTSGPYFGGAFDPSKVSVTTAGTARLDFTDFSHGMFFYTVDGVTGTKSVERQLF